MSETKQRLIRTAFTGLLLLLPGAALAQAAATQIPEPGDAALFALAIAGLIIGHQASKRPPSEK